MSANVYFFIAVIPSIVLHEVSHGYVANFFGDPTAKENHRLTLNPLRHVDPFGTVILPILFVYSGLPAFGYAKPVPVNISRLRDPRRQALYVSLAGPLVNIILSGVGYVMCELSLHVFHSGALLQLGFSFGIVNLILAAFNLLPLPPLDGSAVIERFLPTRKLPGYYRFRAYAFPLVFAFILIISVFTHVRVTAVNDLETWWVGLLF
ncbi:MAG: site-2 protease family protein [Acidimicrobiales bacterium]